MDANERTEMLSDLSEDNRDLVADFHERLAKTLGGKVEGGGVICDMGGGIIWRMKITKIEPPVEFQLEWLGLNGQVTKITKFVDARYQP